MELAQGHVQWQVLVLAVLKLGVVLLHMPQELSVSLILYFFLVYFFICDLGEFNDASNN